MKKLLLKQSIKNIMITIAFMAIVFCGMLAYVNRIEKINSGEFEIVYQYGGDI